VAVKSSGDISAEPVRGQKIEEHVVTDLDVRNDENRLGLANCAVTEERQEVSSKNTIYELSDAGPALAIAGPDWKHFCAAPLNGLLCRKFLKRASINNYRN